MHSHPHNAPRRGEPPQARGIGSQVVGIHEETGVLAEDVVQFIPALRSFARWLSRPGTEADDLVQETLLRAIEFAHTYQRGTNMRAWLFKIMRSRFYNEYHREKREMTGGADCVSVTAQVPATQEWYLRGKELEAALEALPIHYREAIVLVAICGESYGTAAEILGCDIGTVKSRINRGRRALKQKLDVVT